MERKHKETISLCLEYWVLYYAEKATCFCEDKAATYQQIVSYALDHTCGAWDLAEVGAYSRRLKCVSMEECYAIYKWLVYFIQDIFSHQMRQRHMHA